MTPIYFDSAESFRQWLDEHHRNEREVLVGFYKVGTGEPSLTWPESVDAALCYGWIDGVRKRVDDERYTIRFTPRRQDSNWSAVNLKRMEELIAKGCVQPTGLEIYHRRKSNHGKHYSYENRPEDFQEPEKSELQQMSDAAEFFYAQPASYRRMAVWWVISAKGSATRRKRFEQLVDHSRRGLRHPNFSR